MKTIRGDKLKSTLKPTSGTNLSYGAGTASNTLNLDTTLTNMVEISGTSDLSLSAQNELIFLSGNDGGSSGQDFVFRTNRGAGVLEIMRLDGPTGSLGVGVPPNSDYRLNVNGDCNLASGSTYRVNGTAITDTTYTNGTNITIDTSNAINLNTTLTGDITFNGDITMDQDLTVNVSFIGQINPYISTSQADYDQPIVAYQASGVVPTPPANLPLIIPKTNIITVNSSTGLLKSKSIGQSYFQSNCILARLKL